MPIWIVDITALEAASRLGNGQTPPELAWVMPWSLSVSYEMMTSVHSEQTSTRVRS
jgi:hypothetical protein